MKGVCIYCFVHRHAYGDRLKLLITFSSMIVLVDIFYFKCTGGALTQENSTRETGSPIFCPTEEKLQDPVNLL